MIANLFVSTFLSLKAHKLRVFLTMVGIIIGITSVVTISALGEGIQRSERGCFEDSLYNVGW